MIPGPAAAVALVGTYLSLDAAPTAAVEVLKLIIIGEAWETDESVAAERAEFWAAKFLLRCRRLIGDCNSNGQFCEIALNSSAVDHVQGAYFVEGVDSPEVAEAKRKRLGHVDYRTALSRLSPTEFEWACRGMLSCMGVQDALVTRRSADEGIDFFGRLQLSDELRRAGVLPGFYTTLSVWLVGQAKHYKETQAATPDIRELVGSVQLARAGAFAKSGSLPGLDIRICDPVFYLFFTTGRISRDGWALMSSSGVVGMDGEMVAAFLADSEIGRDGGAFSPATFDDWVKSNG